jgi:hypothetical protein
VNVKLIIGDKNTQIGEKIGGMRFLFKAITFLIELPVFITNMLYFTNSTSYKNNLSLKIKV